MRTMLLILMMLISGSTWSQEPPCRATEAARALDFWLGDWTVHAGGAQVGVNGIVGELDGCAVFEHWTNSAGSEGKSLFYFDATMDSWHQVWVTENTERPGGLKLKHMIEHRDGMARFQGELMHPTRGAYLDRTTLTRQTDGSVHQLIEISFDDGVTWQATFDAIYRKVETP